jgi:hypothetical protein
MAMSLANLKKKSSSIDKLTKELGKLKGTSSKDERFWQPEVDKAGNGYAVIRFLDAPFVDGEDAMPWVQIFNHGFQGPGGWLIENCLTSINKPCPVCEHNSSLWNSGIESNKDIVRKQKRKLSYVANILVVKDSANPSNDGKVFLYKFGKKIFDKIQAMLEPEFEDESAVNPFNFWEGANFKLKIRMVEGYRNYDKSEFDSPSPVSDDDSEIERVWKEAYSLVEFLNPKEFMPYDELKAKLNRVLSLAGATKARTVEEDSGDDEPVVTAGDSNSGDEDDTLEFFRKLAD